MDAFDSVFSKSADMKGSATRKLENGTTRSAKLDVCPKGLGLTLAEYADAAKAGATLSRSAKDDGVTLKQSTPVAGAAARSAILAMGDGATAPRKNQMPEGATA